MKRTLAIITLCVLLLATVGTTAAAVEQKGKSSVYQFGIAANAEHGPGKLIINLDKHTILFNGKGFKAGQRYWLWSAALDHSFGSAVANPAGNLNFQGKWPKSLAAMPAAPAFTLTPSLPTGSMTPSFIPKFERWTGMCAIWTFDASASTGPIYMYRIDCYYIDAAGNAAHKYAGAWDPSLAIQLCDIKQGTEVKATLSVTDTSDWSNTVTSPEQTLPWS